ncbi:hypothetical protein MEX01_50710 [Methylorubrum extorquens]|uniref:hypothetical protein n=1 Tax=Methylorubrum extorquens TaxID=408 RepID=UPI00116B88D9|nr:hypothetical protein [Methylorubrum extorquens]GEL44480.1 hypothetical protein MEX01_50710 [Methylorubrum extorquens]
MIALLAAAAVAAGAANVALVAFMADRVSPNGSAAGEFVAITETTPAAARARAVRAGNENVPAQAAKLAA